VGLCLAVFMGLGNGCGGGGGSPAEENNPSVNTQSDDLSSSEAVSSTGESLTISRSSLPLCKIGIPYVNNAYTQSTVAIKATGASGLYNYSLISGSLPKGLTLKTSGVISGTANDVAGLYSFVVKAKSSLNSSKYGTKTMTLRLMQPGSGSSQPYLTILEDPQAYYVHEDTGMCSATAYYMIMQYYGDNLAGAGPANVDLVETIPNDLVSEITSTSKIATYLLSNTQDVLNSYVFENSTYNLMSKDGSAFYACIQYNSNYSGSTTSGNTERATIFEKDIVPFLQTDSPVFIHLYRPYGIAGHFITLIGYDATTDEILYLDPYNSTFDPRASGYNAASLDWKQVVQRLPRDSFIKKSWYKDSDNYYNARWDGRWIGFTH
jgi:hypothetical protein